MCDKERESECVDCPALTLLLLVTSCSSLPHTHSVRDCEGWELGEQSVCTLARSWKQLHTVREGDHDAYNEGWVGYARVSLPVFPSHHLKQRKSFLCHCCHSAHFSLDRDSDASL